MNEISTSEWNDYFYNWPKLRSFNPTAIFASLSRGLGFEIFRFNVYVKLSFNEAKYFTYNDALYFHASNCKLDYPSLYRTPQSRRGRRSNLLAGKNYFKQI